MCCASSEGRENADSVASLSFVATPPTQPIAFNVAADLALPPRAETVIESHTPLVDGSARHVLLSVFLI